MKQQNPPDPAETLADGLDRLAKKFRKRVRKGVSRGRKDVDDDVHDLRTATRRLLAHLLALKPLGGADLRRTIREVESVLDWTAPLRDRAVEEGHLGRLRPSRTAVAGFIRDLHRGRGRRLDRLNRRLSRSHPGRIRRAVRRISGAVRKDGPDRAAALVSRAFDGVREARLAVDPADPRTLHRFRIAVKHFRYVAETMKRAMPGIPAPAIRSLHAIQTKLGDAHDLEALESDLSARVTERPEEASGNAGVLRKIERRHSALVRAFFKSVDPLLKDWEEIVDGIPRRA